MGNKKPSGDDLAWIIHGVVIAQGFWLLGEVIVNSNLVDIERAGKIIALILILLIAVVDWHVFYSFYDVKYKWYQWVLDYVILSLIAIALQFGKSLQFTGRYECILFLILLLLILILIFVSYALILEAKAKIDEQNSNKEKSQDDSSVSCQNKNAVK